MGQQNQAFPCQERQEYIRELNPESTLLSRTNLVLGMNERVHQGIIFKFFCLFFIHQSFCFPFSKG